MKSSRSRHLAPFWVLSLLAAAPALAQEPRLDAGTTQIDAEVRALEPAAEADAALGPTTAADESLPVGEPLATPELETPLEVGPAPVEGVIDITAKGNSLARRLKESAESVEVIDLNTERRQSADLGEVLARTQGVSVRRQGGLGSSVRLSLNGLSDNQVRVFVDGLPIEYAGFGAGISNLPVNLIERVEIYRGVVPIRFGLDALGGAINIVTRAPKRGAGGNASLELGSFGTTRATASGHYQHKPSGLLARANAFVDYAKNDYPVQVDVANATGGSSRQTVYRTHDAYRASGGGFDVGFLRRRWAEKLMLKGFASAYDKDLQNNLVMTIPYGEARYGGENYGTSLQYVQPLSDNVRFDALLSYGYQRTDFQDLSPTAYDWFGQRSYMLARPGEIDPSHGSYDQYITQHGVFGRFNVAWDFLPDHTLQLNLSPSYTSRGGKDSATLERSNFDPLNAERDLVTMVTGLAYVAKLFDEKLENSLFGKSYLYSAHVNERVASGGFASHDLTQHRLGVGDGLRYHITDWLYGKAAYELATRQPSTDELFGNGARVLANFELRPEHSHNTNLSLVLHDLETTLGTFGLEANFFDRRAHNLIALLIKGEFSNYENIGKVRSTGIELVGSYATVKNFFRVDGNLTYQELRNQSEDGPFSRYRGDRIPNRPYFFANLAGRAALPGAFSTNDEISFTYYLRYVDSFFRGWQRVGAGMYQQYRQTVDTQLSHSLALTYLVRRGPRTYSMSIDAQNVANARLFDEFGAQRPGRGYYFKLTAEL